MTTERMEMIEPARLIPYANNARTHSAEQINKLRASLRRFGFVNPVLVDKDLTILAGHGRVEAAKAEGLEKVPCVFIEHLSEADKRAEDRNRRKQPRGGRRRQLRIGYPDSRLGGH